LGREYVEETAVLSVTQSHRTDLVKPGNSRLSQHWPSHTPGDRFKVSLYRGRSRIASLWKISGSRLVALHPRQGPLEIVASDNRLHKPPGTVRGNRGSAGLIRWRRTGPWLTTQYFYRSTGKSIPNRAEGRAGQGDIENSARMWGWIEYRATGQGRDVCGRRSAVKVLS